MADRAEICERHGLPAEMASELWGSTSAELEADAAAKAAIASYGRKPAQSATPSSPRSLSSQTDEELLALRDSVDQALTERGHVATDPMVAALTEGAGAKAERQRRLVEALHPPTGPNDD